MRDWKLVLTDVVQHPELHGRFLNTLSLLEYIGARKIMKSQEESQITPTVLAHMVEEIRHAQMVKKIAIKVGGSSMSTYAEDKLLCGQEGRDYIQAIDHKALEVLGAGQSWANYLLTTLVVEERAQEIYPLYDQLLQPFGLAGPFKAIYREEEGHLEQVIGLLKDQAQCTEEKINLVRAEEKKFFERFFERVDQELQQWLLENKKADLLDQPS